MTTLYEAWALQRNADHGDPLPPGMAGWTQIPGLSLRNDFTGFDEKAFTGPNGQVVLAFQAASEFVPLLPSSLDGTAISSILAGSTPGQYNSALDAVEQVRIATNKSPITIIGDSLGGALAQLVVSRIGAESKLTATTFGAIGVKSLTDSDSVKNAERITAYIFNEDPAVFFNRGQIGVVQVLPGVPDFGPFQLPNGVVAPTARSLCLYMVLSKAAMGAADPTKDSIMATDRDPDFEPVHASSPTDLRRPGHAGLRRGRWAAGDRPVGPS